MLNVCKVHNLVGFYLFQSQLLANCNAFPQQLLPQHRAWAGRARREIKRSRNLGSSSICVNVLHRGFPNIKKPQHPALSSRLKAAEMTGGVKVSLAAIVVGFLQLRMPPMKDKLLMVSARNRSYSNDFHRLCPYVRCEVSLWSQYVSANDLDCWERISRWHSAYWLWWFHAWEFTLDLCEWKKKKICRFSPMEKFSLFIFICKSSGWHIHGSFIREHISSNAPSVLFIEKVKSQPNRMIGQQEKQ